MTYFFNGGVEEAFPGEERILVPSWKGATYDLHPEMSAAEITEEAVRALREKRFDALVVNFANADMVGHTGKLPETIQAIETLDGCFGILEAACARGRRDPPDDRGPRQRRADAGSRHRPAAHGPHDQPGSVHLARGPRRRAPTARRRNASPTWRPRCWD